MVSVITAIRIWITTAISNALEQQAGTDPRDATSPASSDTWMVTVFPMRWDDDIDGDRVANNADQYPQNPHESADTDGDGLPDNQDNRCR